jgi:hypothetical protein
MTFQPCVSRSWINGFSVGVLVIVLGYAAVFWSTVSGTGRGGTLPTNLINDVRSLQHGAVEAARARAGVITIDDLFSEESARRRLRDSFLAIPMMTAGLPKEQTVQMILRQRHVLRELVFLGMSARFITGSTTGDSFHFLPEILFEAVTACTDAPQAVLYCLLFQDDTVFHPAFYTAVGRIIHALQSEWVGVHLCPGGLSPIFPETPRKYKGSPVAGRNITLYTPDPAKAWKGIVNTTGMGNDTVFASFPQTVWNDKKYYVTAGRPVAFVLRRDKADTYLTMLKTTLGGHDDIRMSRDTTAVNVTMAKTPLLCYHLRSTSTVDTKTKANNGNNEVVPFPYD